MRGGVLAMDKSRSSFLYSVFLNLESVGVYRPMYLKGYGDYLPLSDSAFFSELEEDFKDLGPGIYFLLLGYVVVYVGISTRSIRARIQNGYTGHERNKAFDSLKVLSIRDFDKSGNELDFIKAFSPYFNTQGIDRSAPLFLPGEYLKKREELNIKLSNRQRVLDDIRHERLFKNLNIFL